MAWNIDASHSQVQFTVRHMMISNVRGRFEEFAGTVEFDENDLSTLKVEIEVATPSIYTRDQQRDGHLKSPDFFDVEKYPKMTFKSTGAEVTGKNELKLHGDLTIKDITRPVTLDVEYSGLMKSPWGTTSAGFSAHGKVNRKDWDLVWNQVLESGGLLVGEDVKIDIEVEVVKQEAPAAADVAEQVSSAS